MSWRHVDVPHCSATHPRCHAEPRGTRLNQHHSHYSKQPTNEITEDKINLSMHKKAKTTVQCVADVNPTNLTTLFKRTRKRLTEPRHVNFDFVVPHDCTSRLLKVPWVGALRRHLGQQGPTRGTCANDAHRKGKRRQEGGEGDGMNNTHRNVTQLHMGNKTPD
jgi:hypothetical protein